MANDTTLAADVLAKDQYTAAGVSVNDQTLERLCLGKQPKSLLRGVSVNDQCPSALFCRGKDKNFVALFCRRRNN